MLRARPFGHTTWLSGTWVVLFLALGFDAARGQTDYLDLRERLESSREELRQSLSRSLRPEQKEVFPDDKPGKVFGKYIEEALKVVNAKQDFPEVQEALGKFKGKLDMENETQRRALGVFLGDYTSVRYGNDFVRELRPLVEFKTFNNVLSKNWENPEFHAALDDLSRLAKNLGLTAVNHENQALEIRLEPGRKASGAAPLVLYTDIEVMRPVAYKWDSDTQPFTLALKDGGWIGTGVYGNKGALLANLFALRALRDSGLELARPVVLLIGVAASTPGSGIAMALDKLETQPDLLLAADGTFPYSTGQMGDLLARVASRRGMKSIQGIQPATFYIYKMSCMYSLNTVPAETRTWVLYEDPLDSMNPALDMVNKWRSIIEPHQESIPVTRFGTYVQSDTLHFFSFTLPSHVESPAGRNAIMDVAAALAKVPLYKNSAYDIIRFIDKSFQLDPTGKTAGLFYEDPAMGTTRVNPVQYDRVGDEQAVLIDIRFPVGHDRAWVRARMQELVERYNREEKADLVLSWDGDGREPVQKKPPAAVASWLADAYELGSGDVAPEPAAVSHSHGNVMPQAIPFGPERPGVEMRSFTRHESISERELSDLALTYGAAMAWFGCATPLP